MKKAIAMISISLFLFACGNESETDSARDTTNSTIAPDNTTNSDTMNRMQDTSSYERMPQKSADSVPR